MWWTPFILFEETDNSSIQRDIIFTHFISLLQVNECDCWAQQDGVMCNTCHETELLIAVLNLQRHVAPKISRLVAPWFISLGQPERGGLQVNLYILEEH
jgi:hypothetical protein